MKNYKICFSNISGGLRTKTYFAKDEIDALNKLLEYLKGCIKKVNSIEEIKEVARFEFNEFQPDYNLPILKK